MLTLADLTEGLAGRRPSDAAQPLRHFVIDSREVGPHDVFVAFRGEKTDGHLYVADAFGHGAVAAIVEQEVSIEALLIDLRAAAGDGSLRLRPAAGTTWPIRLEFRVQPGSIGRLQVEGAQRVTYNVPASGSAVLLKLDPGVYTASTALLNVQWHPAAAGG